MGHIPTVIKLLIALRILARGNVVDDIVELSDAGATTVRNIFKTFVVNFDKYFIKMPEGEELAQIINVYSRLGFPGAVGSMDCTHVPWLVCPSELTNLCVGKDPRPSISFQVLVDHSRKVHHVSKGFFGGMNDINVCQFDFIVRNDQNGFLNRAGNARNLYKDVEFTVYDNEGRPKKLRGAYIITDGGYENLSIFVNPNVYRSDRGSIIWSEFLEAVRKDVECTFGKLKNRFHILRGIRFPEQSIVESSFVTCCILHNMLLEIDGYDISTWELDVNWGAVNMDPKEWDLPNVDYSVVHNMDNDSEIENLILPFAGLDYVNETNETGVISLSPGRLDSLAYTVIPINLPGLLRDYLITHFSLSFRLGRIQWPKNMRKPQRLLYNRPTPITEPAAVMRALCIIRETLDIRHTTLLLMINNTLKDVIGDGLFSSISIKKGDLIADFVGEFITAAEGKKRSINGYKGYMIAYTNDIVYDCYKYCLHLHVCKASKANSPHKCFNINTQQMAVANAKLSINYKTKKLSLKAIKDISPTEEILWDYGSKYDYPKFYD